MYFYSGTYVSNFGVIVSISCTLSNCIFTPHVLISMNPKIEASINEHIQNPPTSITSQLFDQLNLIKQDIYSTNKQKRKCKQQKN